MKNGLKKYVLLIAIVFAISFSIFASAAWQGTTWILPGESISSVKTKANFDYLYSLWKRTLDNLYYTEGFVGIGTTTPAASLHIDSPYNDKIRLSGTQTAPHTIFIEGTQGLRLWDDTNGELLRVTETGNVGIGVVTPQTKLDVAGAIKVSDTSLVCSSSLLGAIKLNSVTNNIEYCDGNSWQRIWNDYDNDWTVAGANMYSNVSGSVGIGTTNPTYVLDIQKTVVDPNDGISGYIGLLTAREATFGGGIHFRRSRGTVEAPTVNQVGDILAYVSARGYDGIDFASGGYWFFRADQDVSLGNIPTEFGIALNDGAANVLRFNINSNGETSIYSRGDGTKILRLGIERQWCFMQRGTGAATALELSSDCGGVNNNKNFIINTNGNVGISTTTPLAKLHIWSATNDKLRLSGTQTDPHTIFIEGNQGLRVWDDNNYELFRVTETGNFGIKNSNPTHTLDVNGPAAIHSYFRVGSSAAGGFGAVLSVASGSNRFYIAPNDGAGGYLWGNELTFDPDGLSMWTAEGGLYAYGYRDVTPTGGEILMVGSKTGINIAIDGNEIMARNNGSISPLYLQNEGGDIIVHNVGATGSQFVIKDDGRVGVGTTNPLAPLSVGNNVLIRSSGDVTNTESDIRFTVQGGIAAEDNMYFFIDADNNQTGRVFDFRRNGESLAATAGQSLFTITEEGYVGILGLPNFRFNINATGDDAFHIGRLNGNDFTIDVAGGQGLVNLVAGAKVAPGTNNYVYTGTRGASRILLHDGMLQLMTGNTTTGTAGATVAWNTGLVMDSAGNVGVGEENPSSRLEVAGNIEADAYCDRNGTNCSTAQEIYNAVNIFTGTVLSIDDLNDAAKDMTNYNLYVGHDGFTGTYYNKFNTSLGLYALDNPNTTSLGDGVNNTALGYAVLTNNTTGNNNTGVGTSALRLNTTGTNNTAVGLGALYDNDSGNDNTAVGVSALANNTSGARNSAFGVAALINNTTGINNTSVGTYSLYLNTTGNYNAALGAYALRNNSTGLHNTALGTYALMSNDTGSWNTAAGSGVLAYNTTGSSNSAFGYRALYLNTTGSHNTAQGVYALYKTTGTGNTAVGRNALYENTSGQYNIAIGYEAGRYISSYLSPNSTGSYNIFIGASSKALNDGDQNEIVIGYNAVGNGSNSVTLGNDDITKTILKGNIGVGVTNPQANIHISSAINDKIRLGGTQAAPHTIFLEGSQGVRFWDDNNGALFTLTETGNATIKGSLTVQNGYIDFLFSNTSAGALSKWRMIRNDGTGNWNTYWNTNGGVGATYLTDGYAFRQRYNPGTGLFEFMTAASGTAGSAISTWRVPLSISADGVLNINPAMRIYSTNNIAVNPDIEMFNSGVISAHNNLHINIDADNANTDNYFVIAHNARNNAGTTLFKVLENGRVGIGTASPLADLDMARGTMFLGTSLSTEAARLELGQGRTGNGYAYIDLHGDTTYADYGLRILRGNSGANTWSEIRHRGTGNLYLIAHDAADVIVRTNNLDRFIVKRDTGNVGIGTNAPTEKLEVAGNVKATAFLYASDKRLKTDIKTSKGLSLINKLHGVEFKWKDTGEKSMGLIAQEVEKVAPELVREDPNTGIKSVLYGNLVAPIIEAIKELYREVLSIKQDLIALFENDRKQDLEIEELKAELKKQQKEIEKLKAMLNNK